MAMAIAACLLFLLVSGGTVCAFNITAFLREHPDFSTFNSLLGATNVAGEINNRSSLTILAPTNAQMAPFLASFAGSLPTQEISDVLRFHVLLEYLDWERLQHMTARGTLVTTLYQTTGRAPNDTGAVNITNGPSGQVRVGMALPGAGYNATISGLVAKFPYTISIARLSQMLYPYGFGTSWGAPTAAPPIINVTDVLVKAQGFNFLVSLMEASGVADEFDSDETGAGITLFAPTDDAFSGLNPDKLQGLTAEKKAIILKYHVLLSYYPLGSLQTIVNPMQPTLATQAIGAGSYTLNITRYEGMLAVSTGIVVAPVTQTVFDKKPLAVFAVPRVLLPREIFGSPVAPPPPLTTAPSPVNFAHSPQPPKQTPKNPNVSPAASPVAAGPSESPPEPRSRMPALAPSSIFSTPISAPSAISSSSPSPSSVAPSFGASSHVAAAAPVRMSALGFLGFSCYGVLLAHLLRLFCF